MLSGYIHQYGKKNCMKAAETEISHKSDNALLIDLFGGNKFAFVKRLYEVIIQFEL